MPSKPTFGIKLLRDAVRARVDETSIRAVADEIGMSPSGLHVLLGGTTPHAATREKLVSWYLERRRAGAITVTDADVDAALRVLVHYVRQDSRVDAQQRRVREILRRLNTETFGADDSR